MVQVISAGTPRGPSFGERVSAGVGKGLEVGQQLIQQHQKRKAIESLGDIYNNPDLNEQQKLVEVYKRLGTTNPELAKTLGGQLANVGESPLQKAQREKLAAETSELTSEQDYFNRLKKGGQPERDAQAVGGGKPATGEQPTETQFNINDPSSWSDEEVRKFRAFKGKTGRAKSLAETAENEFKRREKTEKTTKDQKAVKELLRQTGKFKTDEELDEAAQTYDLPTAKTMWKEAKKVPSKSTAQKMIEEESAKGYIAAKNELPKLQATLENVGRLRELGGNLRGPGGYVKSAFNTKSAAEYNTLSASLLDPIIKVFNPVGAVPVTKLNWIRETFAPKASDLASTQEGKLATLERLATQAQQRAQQKIKLFNDYNGEPPESEVVRFDNESSKMMTEFVDSQQYVDKLKKELPEGKILMLDAQGKPLHVDPNKTMPNGMTAIEYAMQFGARVAE